MTDYSNENNVRALAERCASEAGFTRREDGTWRSGPGKFEGEQWFAPYYWFGVLNGEGDGVTLEDGTDVAQFETTDVERHVFGTDVLTVQLHEDEQGFVHLWEC